MAGKIHMEMITALDAILVVFPEAIRLSLLQTDEIGAAKGQELSNVDRSIKQFDFATWHSSS